VPELIKALAAEGASGVAVVVGGVVPPDDVPALRAQGVAAVFPPGTPIPEAARMVLDAIEAREG
jgi:methylmalonyl-CoA mutase